MIRTFLLCLTMITLSVGVSTSCQSSETDEAFERLMDLPQAQEWAGADPVDPAVTPTQGNSEQDLIQWLQKNPGVELGQYEIEGTLLQHAVRADLKNLTIWLLAQGADPTTPLPVYRDPNLDSLGIALKLKHWDIVDVLLNLPTYKKLSSKVLTERYMPYAPDALDQLLSRRFAMPENDMASCLLTYQLEHVAIKQALKLPATELGAIGSESKNPWCQRLPQNHAVASPLPFSTVDITSWQKLDRQIKEPIFKFLIATLKTPQDVEALFRSPLRTPTNLALAQILKPWILAPDSPYKPLKDLLPSEVRKSLAERVSREHIKQWLSDKKMLASWIRLATEGTKGDFIRALSEVPDSELIEHPEIVIEQIIFAENINISTKDFWPSVLQRTALNLKKAGNPAILNDIPIRAWPDLFARGYKIETPQSTELYGNYPVDEIGVWLRRDSMTVKQTWPLLTAQMPELKEHAIEWFLKPFGRSETHECTNTDDSISADDVDRIQIFIALGAKINPAPLLKNCSLNTKPEIFARLLMLGVIAPNRNIDTSQANERLSINTLQCHFAPNTFWLKALSKVTITLADESTTQAIDTVQLVDTLDSDSCGLMISSTGTDQNKSMLGDFFRGPDNLPDCLGRVTHELWTLEENSINTSSLPTGFLGNILSLRDATNNENFLFARGQRGYRCAEDKLPELIMWSKSKPYKLNSIPNDAPALDALKDQCNFNDSTQTCLRINPYSMYKSQKVDDKSLIRFKDFIEQHFSAQHAAYLDAVTKFDITQLSELQKNGVLPYWTLEAIDSVSQSTLPLPEKRRRMAWLFQDATQLSAALNCDSCDKTDDVIIGLGNWLPREDWHPLIKALGTKYDPKQSPARYEKLANQALDIGNSALACRFLTVIAATCPKETATNTSP